MFAHMALVGQQRAFVQSARARRLRSPVYAAKFRVGSTEFPSKKAVQLHARSLLDKYEQKAPGRMTSADHEFLMELVARHPRAEAKIGVGISHFSVTRSKMEGVHQLTRHFLLHRKDGTFTDFSYRKCIDTKLAPGSTLCLPGMASESMVVHSPELPERYRLAALRNAIHPQIRDFRREAFAQAVHIPCPVTKRLLRALTCHVDHVSPLTFQVLVDLWLKQEGISVWDVEVSSEDNTAGVMVSQQQKSSWWNFHLENAHLRILSPEANVSGKTGILGD